MSYHKFAIYLEDLSAKTKNLETNEQLAFKDKDIWHRITNVLRLSENEIFELFDEKINIECKLLKESFSKSGNLFLLIVNKKENALIKPKITLYLGLTRKEAFEASIYYACQMGVEIVQPLLTKKVQRKFGGDIEMQRLKRICIAAAEQSKNFILPLIKNPIAIDKLNTNNEKEDNLKLYCHIDGDNLFSTLSEINKKNFQRISIAAGPEGDFTEEECQILKSNGFRATLLTPTILRSEDAVCVALGSIRSVAKNEKI